MADGSSLVKWGLIIGGAYAAYEFVIKPMLGTTPTTTTTTTSTADTTAKTQSAAQTAGLSLDQIYASLLAALKASASDPAITSSGGVYSASPDTFWWYLTNRAIPTLPTAAFSVTSMTFDPAALFPGVDRSSPMTSAQFWAGVGPAIGKQLGLSGLGLAGLAALYLRRRAA